MKYNFNSFLTYIGCFNLRILENSDNQVCLIETNMYTKFGVNIIWRDAQRKNVVNNVDMSSLRAPWQNSPYKNQHTERYKNR